MRPVCFLALYRGTEHSLLEQSALNSRLSYTVFDSWYPTQSDDWRHLTEFLCVDILTVELLIISYE
jgi:hypothetical protein